MSYCKLNNDLYWVGSLDSELRVFDIIMHTEYGTTYNAYFVKGSEKQALFETTKFKFWDSYKETLESLVNIKEIDYLIVSHTEPDHAGSIEKLLEINPGITIVGTGTAIGFLQQIVNGEFLSLVVKENDTLSLGDKTIQFMPLPNLHWPDTMYTYVEEEQVLFTCDSFGSHFSHEGIVRSTVIDEEGYLKATKYYFDNIIAPFKHPYMTRALERIKDLPIRMICTGHGPVLDSHLEELFSLYHKWCEQPPRADKPLVVIPYVSAYGYTKELAECIQTGIEESGEIQVELYDMVEADEATVLGRIALADGLLFGTPTIVGEALAPIWKLLISMFPPTHKGKLASAFGSYGWSGEGVPHVMERLHQLRLKVLDGFRVRFKPSESEKIDANDYGYNFGCVLQNKENPRQVKQVPGMVKCLVCSAIFADTNDNCPVCGVGRENFIPAEDTTPEFRLDTEEKYLILGGGAAAFYAAKGIRERNHTASIVLISNESELPYNRPMLTKSMLGEHVENQLAIEGNEWYEENSIYVLLGKQVISIDAGKKQVVCQEVTTENISTNPMTFVYDKLIYALGAECFVPPIPGREHQNVATIRRISDVEGIRKSLPKIKDVVVIGGGVLGLEAAWQMKRCQANVTVLEMAERILPRQLDVGGSEMLARMLEKKGIDLILQAGVKEITGEAVILTDGRVLPAQLVIVSTGISPNVALAKEAGIEAGRFIEVNEFMETNLPDVYACGDCAAFEGMSLGLWSWSMAMGEVAGATAAGDKAPYRKPVAGLTFHGLDTSLYALGDAGKNPELKYRTVEMKDEQRMTYEKLYFAKNQLVGVILLGDTSLMAYWTEKVSEQATYAQVFPGKK